MKFDILPERVRQVLEYPHDFAWSGGPEMFDTWSIGPIVNTRDLESTERRRIGALVTHVKRHKSLVKDWKIVRCSHWGPGWVDHLTFRVLEEDRKTPTRIFQVIERWFSKRAEVG